jgi:hypothetical protein
MAVLHQKALGIAALIHIESPMRTIYAEDKPAKNMIILKILT